MPSDKLTILIGTDFSLGAEVAFGEAIRLARGMGGEVDVVHVMPSTVEAPTELFVAGSQELAGLGDARARLENYFEYAAGAGVPLRAHIRMGGPVIELLDAIHEMKPDLVVLGSHGHGAVARALFGSVSDEIWHRSGSQVLIIPATRLDRAPTRLPVGKSVRRVAWSCKGCGHIFAGVESVERCAGCGDKPARWFGAPIEAGPVDELLPHVGHAAGENEARIDGGSSSGIAVGPSGTDGYDVNPELRVRY